MNFQSSSQNITLFRTVPVVLYGNGTEIKTFAVLDEGSALTMIDADLATVLKLRGQTRKISLQVCG